MCAVCASDGGKVDRMRWSVYDDLRRFNGLLWAGWYWDMGRTSKRRETALKTIDGEALI